MHSCAILALILNKKRARERKRNSLLWKKERERNYGLRPLDVLQYSSEADGEKPREDRNISLS